MLTSIELIVAREVANHLIEHFEKDQRQITDLLAEAAAYRAEIAALKTILEENHG